MNDRLLAPVSTVAAKSLSRRTSLLGLGGAVTGILATSSATGAKKRKRKTNANRQCKKQESRCAAPVSAMCIRNDIPPDICEEQFLPCCRFFNTCDAAQALACLHFTS